MNYFYKKKLQFLEEKIIERNIKSSQSHVKTHFCLTRLVVRDSGYCTKQGLSHLIFC